MTRPTKDEYYLGIAAAVAKRSTCIRRQYGAVIVKDDQIISTGYNGACRGEQNCIDFGECYRDVHNIPHGERYELCKAVHAEQNAILSANRADMIGAALYLAGFENGQQIKAEPCLMCSRMIKNARIAKVVGTEGLPVCHKIKVGDAWIVSQKAFSEILNKAKDLQKQGVYMTYEIMENLTVSVSFVSKQEYEAWQSVLKDQFEKSMDDLEKRSRRRFSPEGLAYFNTWGEKMP